MSQQMLVSESLRQLELVRASALICTACRLHETRQNVVFSDGNPHAKLLFIGEAPGQQEDEAGRPFVGRAGKVLTQLIETVGFNREEETYICNIVKCRPPDNRVPLEDETEACSGYLKAQLQLVDPRLIILVGKTALKGILGLKTPMGKIRGQWVDTPAYPNAKIMTIFHPSYLLRNPSLNEGSPKWQTLEDLKEVRREYENLKH